VSYELHSANKIQKVAKIFNDSSFTRQYNQGVDMISLNVHNIDSIKVEPAAKKVFKGSYCRKINIKTSEVDNMEIYLFADKPESLNNGLNGKGK